MMARKEDIEIFANQCVFVRSIYRHTKTLFEDSTADDRALMERTASIFFSDLRRVLTEDPILQVCKIMIRHGIAMKSENHTVARNHNAATESASPRFSINTKENQSHRGVRSFRCRRNRRVRLKIGLRRPRVV